MKKIKKGDEVIVIAGKDKGKKGIILTVLNAEEKVIVEGINLVKKHVKANPNAGERGGVVTKPMPIHRSNVMLHDPTSQKGSRVGIRTEEDGKKVRYFKSSNELVNA
ncbi:MAG: 50S ribosomal protein L24 [Gammaproteobacteria bacterium RIFCSPHIGHO2_12_FULL_41_20]|nr:MAG: 50S ribosomal protein L24 [Gammaproteobacteria bacterium RIFCSPHIGHO2_12_FULL_41_20]